MNDRDELIGRFVRAVHARAGGEACLKLPDYWDEATWRRVLTDAEILELAGGQVLMAREEASSDLYFLADGTLEISVPKASSMSMSPPVVIGPGAVVGEMSFFDSRARSASVWSRGKSIVLRIRRPAFEAFRSAEPALACDLLFAIACLLTQRLRRSHAGTGSNGTPSAFGAGY